MRLIEGKNMESVWKRERDVERERNKKVVDVGDSLAIRLQFPWCVLYLVVIMVTNSS